LFSINGRDDERMTAVPARDADLTARARIRDRAFALFAERGIAATPIRTIAAAAGVSPALVLHHFGSKDGLVQAVEDVLLETLTEQFEQIERTATPDVFSARASETIAEVLGSNPVLRQYLRRSLLEEHPTGATLVDQLFAWTERGIDIMGQAGALRADADPTWRPYQVLYVVLGPLLLETLLERHLGADAFDPDVIAARSQANHDFFAHGLLA
jgi:AcrR family transcriptional regulator